MKTMKIVHGPQKLEKLAWPVVTLGMFDGMHLGHQQILSETVNWARSRNGEAIVLTFSSHPRTVTGGRPPGFITSLQHRLKLMERQGVDIAVVFDFDRKFAEITADEFVDRFFCKMIGARGIVIGFNNRFGRNREGGVELLRQLGPQKGFEVREVGPARVDGGIVSSTAVRAAIREGNLDRAAAMLGRPVSLMGSVVSGEGRGRTLGFPTANLDLHHETCPPAGVYAGRVAVEGREYKALTSIGSQPTFHAPDSPVVVEVYLLDFCGNLYGKDLEVVLVKKLRDQMQFKSAGELIARMKQDAAETERM